MRVLNDSPRLVLRRHIVQENPPAGRFSDLRIGKGFVPAGLYTMAGTFCADTSEPFFALTYDDGPDPEATPRILDVLARYDAKATFFVLGDATARHPDVVRRAAAEGHEIALHGYDHTSLLTMSPSMAKSALTTARTIVEDTLGAPVALFRPAYGQLTLRQALIIRMMGLELTLWSGNALDWVDDDDEAVATRACAAVFPGAILLLHDRRADPETLALGERAPTFDRSVVLDLVLDRMAARGCATLTVGDLLHRFPRVKSVERHRMASA